VNYLAILNAIIYDPRNHLNDGYVEEHHIVPRSLGGTDDPENLINLSARQHFIVHWLLHKIYQGTVHEKKMTGAFMFMVYLGKSKLCSSSYKHVKEAFSEAQRGKKMSENSRQKMRETFKRNQIEHPEYTRKRVETRRRNFKERWENDEEFRTSLQSKIRAVHLGRKRSPETCARLKVSLKGHAPFTGKTHSLETRKKQSASAKNVNLSLRRQDDV